MRPSNSPSSSSSLLCSFSPLFLLAAVHAGHHAFPFVLLWFQPPTQNKADVARGLLEGSLSIPIPFPYPRSLPHQTLPRTSNAVSQGAHAEQGLDANPVTANNTGLGKRRDEGRRRRRGGGGREGGGEEEG